jgi:hypothetical protein
MRIFGTACVRKLLVLMTLAAAMSIAVPACGGGSSSSGAAPMATADDQPISKAELIRQADAVCRQTDVIQKKRLAAYEEAHPNLFLGGPAGEEALRRAVFPPIGKEIAKILALGIPRGDKAQIQAILRGWLIALKKVEDHPGIVLIGEGPFTRPDKLAAKYGFKDCSKAL